MRLVIAGVLALLASQADAAECNTGRSDAILLKSWTPEATKTIIGQSVKVHFVLTNGLSKGFRMADASVFFDDVLGNHIGGYVLEPDMKVGAGADVEISGNYPGMTRLLEADPADIVVRICTKAVVYEDGSQERFD